jgi:hypothetical protein
MATVPNIKTVTYEEWLRMPESREEVVNGEIRQMASPVWKHCDIVDNMRDLVLEQVEKNGSGLRPHSSISLSVSTRSRFGFRTWRFSNEAPSSNGMAASTPRHSSW